MRRGFAAAFVVMMCTVMMCTADVLVAPAPVMAAPAPDYCAGQCADILPPGENGNATLAGILANRVLGTQPAHADDQLGRYADLVGGYRGLTGDNLDEFFNDSSFGVPDGQAASTIHPRADVTIVRDKATGVPHIYGSTRSGTEFGAGYAAASDRLWMMDVFRHVARGQLSGFAGGAVANRSLEQEFWRKAPYTEADLQAQIDAIAASGPRGQQALADVNSFVDGINGYIEKSYRGRYFPGEYALAGHVNAITNAGRIEPFRKTDLVAIASVIGALFGAGGGDEVASALVKMAAQEKLGAAKGERVWQAFREQNDPEAVTTVHDGTRFDYGASPARPEGVAMPDAGSITPQQQIYDASGSATAAGIFDNGVLPANLISKQPGMSNALVVSGRHAIGGHPVAVFGPQTGYFAPQLLMLEELQGPGISARGAAFAGLNFYVQLGRGQDYAWSATSAAQDITDTYAVELCDTDGTSATRDSIGYRFHGVCLPMETLDVRDSWKPTLADSTPAGSYTLRMFRTRYGLVQSRATVAGKPVAFTSLRSSYRHEVDSIIGFQMFNDPNAIRSASDFQHAAANINYTFNWFYVDSKDTAYFNSGTNPIRPDGVDENLPTMAEQPYEWKGWNSRTNVASYTPNAEHPQSVNQDYYISWNNKQAPGYTSAAFGTGSVHRGDLLDERVRLLVRSGTPVDRAALASAMAEAAVTDLRGEQVLPELLEVIRSAPVTDPRIAAVVDELERWQRDGARRAETSPGSEVYAHADAIRTLDAWWPLLVKAEFLPGMGDRLYAVTVGVLQVDEPPFGSAASGSDSATEAIPHKGSSFQLGWWSYVDKDLRAVLGQRVDGPLDKKYCGGGDLAACRKSLLDSLSAAVATPAKEVYHGGADCAAGDQWCADTIIQRPVGGLTHRKISWQNRPTYQQVIQFPAHRPR